MYVITSGPYFVYITGDHCLTADQCPCYYYDYDGDKPVLVVLKPGEVRIQGCVVR